MYQPHLINQKHSQETVKQKGISYQSKQYFSFKQQKSQLIKCSSFHMMIEGWEELKPGKEIRSEKIQFLDSDDVWWFSIEKFNRRLKLAYFLHTRDCIWKSKMWSCSVSGSANQNQFTMWSEFIVSKMTNFKEEIALGSLPNLDLKLVMTISQRDDLDQLPPQKFVDTTRQCKSIISNNESILNSSRFSDFTFIIQEKMFKVHRSVVAPASPVFEKLFDTKFSESVNNECHITDIDPITFQHLLIFIYCGKLPEQLHEHDVTRKLFKAAHYYEIKELVDICTSVEYYKLSKDNALDMYEWADTYNLDDVKKDAWRIIQFEILEIFEEQPCIPIYHVRSLIAIKEEKEKCVEEFQLKLSKLEATAKDLLK